MMKLVGKFYKEKVCRIRNEYGAITPEATPIPKPDQKNFYQNGKKLPKKT